MKLRTLSLIALVLFVGLTSSATAGMNRQRRAGAGFGVTQSTVQNNVKNCNCDSSQTCINDGAQKQRRNGQAGNGQGCLKQGGNRQNRYGQNSNGKGRNGQNGNGQKRRGQGGNKQGCNCDGTCINQ